MHIRCKAALFENLKEANFELRRVFAITRKLNLLLYLILFHHLASFNTGVAPPYVRGDLFKDGVLCGLWSYSALEDISASTKIFFLYMSLFITHTFDKLT